MQQVLNSKEVDDEVLSDSLKKTDSEDADNDEWLQWQKDEHRAFHWVKMGCIYGVPVLAAVVIIVYFWNLLMPSCVRWLCTEELSGIQSLAISIVSGVSTSLAVNYFYKSK